MSSKRDWNPFEAQLGGQGPGSKTTYSQVNRLIHAHLILLVNTKDGLIDEL